MHGAEVSRQDAFQFGARVPPRTTRILDLSASRIRACGFIASVRKASLNRLASGAASSSCIVGAASDVERPCWLHHSLSTAGRGGLRDASRGTCPSGGGSAARHGLSYFTNSHNVMPAPDAELVSPPTVGGPRDPSKTHCLRSAPCRSDRSAATSDASVGLWLARAGIAAACSRSLSSWPTDRRQRGEQVPSTDPRTTSV